MGFDEDVPKHAGDGVAAGEPINRRRSLPNAVWVVVIVALVGGLGAVGVVQGAERRTDNIQRVSGLDGALSAATGETIDESGEVEKVSYPSLNFLLVGSDSRAGTDVEAEEAAYIGSTDAVGGQRSDTMMVLRLHDNGAASLMSVPRDLWVDIWGQDTRNRINVALNYGAETLIRTVSAELDIPIHHYVQVDFSGFQSIVESVGGVNLCFETIVRDLKSGLRMVPGCHDLGPVEALAYARSRQYEEWDGQRWVIDPSGDRGRVVRQQQFIRAATNGALAEFQSKPFTSGDTLDAVTQVLVIDDTLDPLFAARAMRQAASVGLTTYVLPTVDDTVGDAAVLRLADDAGQVLDFFAGTGGPPPPEYSTGTTGDQS